MLYKSIQLTMLWAILIAFIIFYPMLISIYVFLPLLIGIMGYILIRGIELNKISYILFPIIYFMNLESNLTLPFFITIIATFLVYVLFYKHLSYFRKCKLCRPVLSVLLIDFVYLAVLLTYDFVFETSSVVLDNILMYSLIIDLLVVVLI